MGAAGYERLALQSAPRSKPGEMARVAIVGAGVSGLSVGLCLAETHVTRDLNLTIFSDKFSCPGHPRDGITSDRAGGFIRALDSGTSDYGGTANESETRRWATVTYERLQYLQEDGSGTKFGLIKPPFLMGHEDSPALPWYTTLHPEFRVLSPTEAVEHGMPPGLKTVWKFDCYCIDTSLYLDWLRRCFTERGGLVVRRRIKNLGQLTRDYDIVVNCTGLGARELVGDSSLYPVRGQLLELGGVNMKAAYHVNELGREHITYTIPRLGSVILGGSAESHNWSTDVNAEQTESIYRRCVEMCPQLAGSKVVRTWAGLRPARPTVRVEVDSEFGGESLLLHNYGHGGHGFTLSWGCATDITEMIATHLQLETKSKL